MISEAGMRSVGDVTLRRFRGRLLVIVLNPWGIIGGPPVGP